MLKFLKIIFALLRFVMMDGYLYMLSAENYGSKKLFYIFADRLN